MHYRHIEGLRYAPGRNAAVQAQYLAAVKTISDALLGAELGEPPSKIYLGLSRSGASGILKWVLDRSYAQGMYEGLRDGWRLHTFGVRLERDLRHKYIVRYLQKHPKTEDRTDEKICMFLDSQINRLDNKDDDKKPMPLNKWRNVSWAQALLDKTKTGKRNRVCDSVMSYLTFCRQIQESKEYALLRAWEELTRKSEKVRHFEANRRQRAKVRRLASRPPKQQPAFQTQERESRVSRTVRVSQPVPLNRSSDNSAHARRR